MSKELVLSDTPAPHKAIFQMRQKLEDDWASSAQKGSQDEVESTWVLFSTDSPDRSKNKCHHVWIVEYNTISRIWPIIGAPQMW